MEGLLESTKCLKHFVRFPTPENGLATGAPVYVPCEVGPNPVCRLRENAIRCSRLRAEGGFQKRCNVLHSAPRFGGPGASEGGF